MTRILAALLAGGSLCLWTMAPFAVQAADKAPPPITAFGKVPAMRAVVLSPDGQQLAWIDNSGARAAVEVFDLAKNARRLRMESTDDLKIRDLDWADDEILLIHNSITHSLTGAERDQHEWFRIKALNVRNGTSQILLQKYGNFSFVTGATLLQPRTTTAKKVTMASWSFSGANYRQETGSRLTGGRKDEGWTYNLFEVDITTGQGRISSEGTPFTDEWVVDTAGQAVARSEWDANRKRFTVLHRRGQGWTEIFSLDTGEHPTLPALAPDASAVLMFGNLRDERIKLWRLPFDGSAPQVALEHSQHDLTALVLDPHTRQPVGAWVGGPIPEMLWLDDLAGKKSQALRKTFGGKHAELLGRSADGSRVLVHVSSAQTPATYYLIDYKRGAADIVGEAYPQLAEAALGEVRSIAYKARDGYDVPAYLTLPPAVDPKQLALVVLPHGGPEARDDFDFNWEAQFLASRGYAVLQPQFRGSSGFTAAHTRAGYRQWGGLMQDDVTDGVKAMIEQGIVDPHRVCIVGGSYGGYAALVGAAFTPELYACAISINGVSDLPLMLGHVKQQRGAESDMVAYWAEHIGSPIDPPVIAKSPARAVNGIRAPILLLHGSGDTVVPPVQAQVMITALKGKGKPYRFVELPGEDHWLSRSESRILVLTEMEKFLGEHLAASPKGGD